MASSRDKTWRGRALQARVGFGRPVWLLYTGVGLGLYEPWSWWNRRP